LTVTDRQDDEVRFVFGWMMSQFPWCCGDGATEWEREGKRLWAEWLNRPDLPSIETFGDRGAYGQYFAHIRSRKAGTQT
jgi:hypothetical protein